MNRRSSKPGEVPKQPAFTDALAHRFSSPALLTLALTHRSLVHESHANPGSDPGMDNEQLEFLGDAVLGLLSAEALYRRFPAAKEGELTRLRASIVSRAHLGEVAARLHLGEALHLGRGEERTGGRSKSALLANALEAVIAAIYLDGGLLPTRTFVETHIVDPAMPDLRLALRDGEDSNSAALNGAVGDHKSALQEYLQALGLGQPVYVLTQQSGPDHQKSFRLEVRIASGDAEPRTLAEAEASTKKKAQQEAARLALQRLRSEPGLAAAAASSTPVPPPPSPRSARQQAAR